MAEGRIGKTQGYVFSMDDAANVGMDEGTPVTTEYPQRGNAFTGTIHQVTVKTSATQFTPSSSSRWISWMKMMRRLSSDRGLAAIAGGE